MSRPSFPALVAAFLALVLAGCAPSIRVSHDYDPSADYSGYRTWSWLAQPVPEVIDPRVHNDLVDERVRRVVERALASKGYQKLDPGQGDFGVRYHAAIEGKVSVQTINDTYGYGPGWGPGPARGATTQTYVREWNEGTLVLDVVDGKSRKLVWRASAQAEVSAEPPPPEERDETLKQAVDDMLADFPPS